jgi:hypothetical protein
VPQIGSRASLTVNQPFIDSNIDSLLGKRKELNKSFKHRGKNKNVSKEKKNEFARDLRRITSMSEVDDLPKVLIINRIEDKAVLIR